MWRHPITGPTFRMTGLSIARSAMTIPNILLILLEAGTDPNIHGEHVPALHVAAANDNVEAAKILISHGAKIDVRDTVNNDTALLYGIRDGKFSVAELLLEAGADPNLTDRRGFAPLPT